MIDRLTTLDGIRLAAVIIRPYTGVLSVGIAYTVQVLGQRYANAADAAIVLSAETLFAALLGSASMGDFLNAVGIAGGALFFVCIVAVQMMPLTAALSLNGKQF